jgi:hypothetical protein
MPNSITTGMRRFAPLLLPILLASCATIPSGPGVMVLPGSGKNFDQFRQDDISCRQFAREQAKGQTPSDAAIYSGAGTAVLWTGLGAALGAIFGGGSGAAIGAGSGLLAGGLMGANTATTSGNTRQQRYDISYTQCMYGKGHNVPVPGQIANEPRNQPGQPTQPAPSYSIPPPPPGTPPAAPQ